MPRSRIAHAHDGLLPENYERLNRDFYEARPWVYVDRRLGNLARVTANTGQREASSETYRIGPVETGGTVARSPMTSPLASMTRASPRPRPRSCITTL